MWVQRPRFFKKSGLATVKRDWVLIWWLFSSDAIALNIGSDDWQRNQVASAYAAAQASGTGIKLFYSFDLTEMPCDLNDLVARVNLYKNHPNQFKVNGKTFISSYSGDCLGNSGWQSLKDQTNGYIMPFIWGLEGSFGSWPSLDSWYWWVNTLLKKIQGRSPQMQLGLCLASRKLCEERKCLAFTVASRCWFYCQINDDNYCTLDSTNFTGTWTI